ncbi:MAG: hypothetical protein ACUVS2_02175 [Candidatus Flexifilum sp.]|jgi:cytochrome c oxidase subunit 2
MIHIDRFERLYIIVLVVVLGVFFASVIATGVVFGFNPPSNTAFVNPNQLDQTIFANPGLRHMGGNRYDLVITAQMWVWNAGSREVDAGGHQIVRIPVGSEVTFFVTSRDIQHQLIIEQHNLNLQIVPGQVSRNVLRFNRPGQYQALCGEYCGRGHQGMYMTFIVEEAPQTAAVPGA